MLPTLDKEMQDAVAELPEQFRVAQAAVETDEVQNALQVLAKYNLGACMPHMHRKRGEFIDLPSGTVGVENTTDFMSADEALDAGALPVAWRWRSGGVEATGSCHVRERKCDG